MVSTSQSPPLPTVNGSTVNGNTVNGHTVNGNYPHRTHASTSAAAVNGTSAHHANASSPATTLPTPPLPAPKPTILHLGDEICYNPDIHERLLSQFNIERLKPGDLQRPNFIKHLKDRKWGNFSAIMKPFWSTGSEMHPWDRELIELLPQSMKIMAGAGAGFDWVDTEALAKRGVIYTNGAHASTESVATSALYHIIAVFTHATSSSIAARSGSPQAFQEAHTQIPFISHNPMGHTLGIVGLGLIGSVIAQKARQGLGMRILYHDLFRKSVTQENELNARYFTHLEEMLPECDCVLLATPSGPKILTASTLKLMKKGARVVNIARGTLIDEDALADALESGHISAAGLDVHANEPVDIRSNKSVVNSRFLDNPSVQLTCHTGGASVETNEGFERLVMENVEAVLNGREPLTAVNLRWMTRENLLGAPMEI